MAVQTISEMVEKSKKAQQVYEGYTQEQVDEAVKLIARTVFDHAQELAKMAVEETGMGCYEDKVNKCYGKSRIIYHHLKGKRSVGVIGEDKEKGLIYVAKPKGVVGSVAPCTNPVVTAMCNAMFALKGRNSIIIAPHPRAKKCTAYTVELINEKLAANYPADLIQVIEEPDIETTGELMKAVDVVIATGGMGMVKAAYSSGKPAFGVGAGNVQCIIDRGMDLSQVIPKVVTGRAFDNGIICSGEQMAIIHEDDYEEAVKAFQANGGFLIRDEVSLSRLRDAMFDEKGVMNRKLVGRSAAEVAELAGISVPEGTKVIVAELSVSGRADKFCKEKMCPVIGLKTYKTFEEAVEIAAANLEYEGLGHTVAIHSDDKAHLIYAGEKLHVSRILVNQIGATMNGGSFVNGLAPTTTLGCGSWGNNSISENLDFKHLINITRVACVIEGAVQPSDEEIWS
ncbi:aldehyde dehydrogenase family protein [Bacilliculturomica massiliensis]|uniref:aldehyde dehydrogenase family protein n=1 Tax=Bacilliculturomica massiliensis TaxID=1917867 RepID=UPI0010316926|nr:aldehyde dehydrogenase family protein [Bacilliculturomica massiliensis]